MATVIYPSGVIVNVGTPSFDELKNYLDGGLVEVATTDDGGTMVLDEEGKLKELPLNKTATTYLVGQTKIAQAIMSGVPLPDYVVGVAILFDTDNEADLVLGRSEPEAGPPNENDWQNMVRQSKPVRNV